MTLHEPMMVYYLICSNTFLFNSVLPRLFELNKKLNI